ncbi:type IV pilus assembly protein PilY1 [Luteibacter sp. UNC138MFCol5.1]|uniref:pilus assembly protein n=1 Tax=Luteibacter sp. UNC138MFCol5.1 TaxID=1502774 RepID=UPI0008AF5112|nr:PilC/PilY family type IV pilus protein [Luteibacter sp. UNC138MFCol5.1]SEO62763.1 type IV pilus assembly protein PilY1 [Luteibacter sp. UNC138MFCol5.1]
MSATHRLLTATAAVALTAFGALPGIALADRTNLGAPPPDLTTSVAPNIAVTFDDSGSMQSYFMGDKRPFDEAGWGTKSPWMCAGVIDPRIKDKTDLRSSAMNGVYYNPNIVYTPPVGYDGTPYPNADKTLSAVWMNGIDVNRRVNAQIPGAAVVRSNQDSSDSANDGRVAILNGKLVLGVLDSRWDCTPDAVNPFDGKVVDPNGLSPNGGPYYFRLISTANVLNADKSMNAKELYKASNWEAVAVPVADYQNFANWFAYYRTRNMMTRTTLTQAFSKIGNSVRIAWQNMASSSAPATRFGTSAVLLDIGALGSDVRRDFYDWITQVVGSSTTPARAATIRASNVFRSTLSKDKNDPYWNGLSGNDSKDLVCRRNFHMLVTDGYWNEGNPTLPAKMESKANITQTAQTLPDKKAYDPGSINSKVYSNVAGDAVPSSMANIAWFYWATDSQPTLDDGVKPYWADLTSDTPVDPKNIAANDQVYWNPANDPATWQHVAQFFVTLGVAGTLNFPSDLPALKAGTKAWPQPANNSPEGIDDTWHGAIDSRGGFFSASDPATLVNSLVNIINSVISTSSSAVSAALSSGVISTDSVTYVPSFSSSDWTGKLEAYAVTSSGNQGNLLWEAGKLLTDSKAARVIVTSAGPGEGNGIDFRYANMTTAQKAIWDVADPVAGTTDANGEKRVNWVRGDRTEEGGLLRTRSLLLGPIVNAQPVYVSYPASGYRDYFPPIDAKTPAPETAAYQKDPKNSYSQYVSDNLTRQPILYVAANDGMMHAFDARLAKAAGATPGAEQWAYVPAASYNKLWYFTRKDNFAYQPTVDATPIFRDVYFSQNRTNSSTGWHTILIGGLRYGGRGIYAIDITDPTGTSTSAVAKKVLWEFNSSSPDGANLGYTFGQPNVGRLANGKWVVVVPAGYFPTDSLDPAYGAAAATSKQSSLFVLDAQTGELLKEFKTPLKYSGADVNSFGLGPPVLGDYDNDQIDDVAFAGDLAGNLWRFDLRDISKGTVDLLYKATAGSPTGTAANDQPITVMPRLFPDPNSQYFDVVFGTGKFLGPDDRTTVGAKTQSVYGIRDTGLNSTTGLPWTRDKLQEQDLVEDASQNRGLTSNAVATTKGGWFFDLDVSAGERVVVTPTALFNTNRAIITTLIPTSPDPCNPGRAGALMVIDAATGSAGAGVGGTGSFGAGYTLAGARVDNPPATGNLPAATLIGGGTTLVPGVTLKGKTDAFSIGSPIWRRRSWRILNDQ